MNRRACALLTAAMTLTAGAGTAPAVAAEGSTQWRVGHCTTAAGAARAVVAYHSEVGSRKWGRLVVDRVAVTASTPGGRAVVRLENYGRVVTWRARTTNTVLTGLGVVPSGPTRVLVTADPGRSGQSCRMVLVLS